MFRDEPDAVCMKHTGREDDFKVLIDLGAMMLRKLFCKHRWEKVSERLVESNMERLVKRGIKGFQYLQTDLQATHIVVCKCDKCGTLQKLVTKT